MAAELSFQSYSIGDSIGRYSADRGIAEAQVPSLPEGQYIVAFSQMLLVRSKCINFTLKIPSTKTLQEIDYYCIKFFRHCSLLGLKKV
jgi:hypothetical protein